MSSGNSICLVCDRPVHLRGYCGPHYHRMRRHGDPLAGGTHVGAPRAFIEQMLNEMPTGCVTWPFVTSRGYGYVAWEGRHVSVSRLVCRLVHGDPPDISMHAAHRCGNGSRGCVRPACLYWATQKENESDKIRHGTLLVGEKCAASKLTDAQADAIRIDTRIHTLIAAEYGISPAQVSRIKSGKSRAYAARLAAAEERMREGTT